ncbi:hypothetical protein PHISCL_00840 [Aspergillus sclerotialis]|uniref:Nucleotidyl transferase AbiEii toxin, Type IV TA system n=1 Tax=Aspergillus sclerotialis TaxID=2070753 RepID=A0A3A3A9Z5_9EURO|nr:hypothetical protein PHISCL_00840 [Aspergillus sclerotialis]
MATANRFAKLEQAAVAIIGGLAVKRYLRTLRETEDVDFLVAFDEDVEIGKSGPMGQLPLGIANIFKGKLCERSRDDFEVIGQAFYVKIDTINGRESVQIDFTTFQTSPYIPNAATPIREIDLEAELPYISLQDLVIFKIFSCGLRASDAKRYRDDHDAEHLIRELDSQGQIVLSDRQKEVVEGMDVLDDVVKALGQRLPKYWWEVKLNLYW